LARELEASAPSAVHRWSGLSGADHVYTAVALARPALTQLQTQRHSRRPSCSGFSWLRSLHPMFVSGYQKHSSIRWSASSMLVGEHQETLDLCLLRAHFALQVLYL